MGNNNKKNKTHIEQPLMIFFFFYKEHSVHADDCSSNFALDVLYP